MHFQFNCQLFLHRESSSLYRHRDGKSAESQFTDGLCFYRTRRTSCTDGLWSFSTSYVKVVGNRTDRLLVGNNNYVLCAPRSSWHILNVGFTVSDPGKRVIDVVFGKDKFCELCLLSPHMFCQLTFRFCRTCKKPEPTCLLQLNYVVCAMW